MPGSQCGHTGLNSAVEDDAGLAIPVLKHCAGAKFRSEGARLWIWPGGVFLDGRHWSRGSCGRIGDCFGRNVATVFPQRVVHVFTDPEERLEFGAMSPAGRAHAGSEISGRV